MKVYQHCLGCGNAFTGNYCNQCGEKVYDDHEKTFGHFIGHTLHFLTHLDNKFLKSFVLVFRRPGFLSMEICRGVRKKYFPPLNLFLIGVILYLLFPLLQGLNMSLESHLSHIYAPLLQPMVQYKLKSSADMSALAADYARIAPTVAKPLLLIIIPLCALVLSILFRKSRRYFYDHMTLSAELNTFFIFLSFFILPLFDRIFRGIDNLMNGATGLELNDPVMGWLVAGALFCFCIIAFRRFYKEKYLWIILKSVLFLIWQTIVIFILYRIIHVTLVLLFI